MKNVIRMPGRKSLALAMAGSVAILLVACGGSGGGGSKGPGFPAGAIFLDKNNLTASAKNALINAKSGDVIVFPEGTYNLSDTLTLNGQPAGGAEINGITLTGYGQGRTVLDFSTSVGGDGLSIQNIKNITISNLSVIEAANNAIKIKGGNGIHIHHTSTEWRGALSNDNGAYGLYPVESQNIVLENNYVRGSADAGIYVGQSENIVVRHNVAEENVAGIEIENSKNADVYKNVARKNTGGILVFDLPIGNHLYGSTVRVFDNEVDGNNTENFANSSSNPAGVHIVPPGTGVIVLSTRDVEIYNNIIKNHETTSVAVSSFFIAASMAEMGGYVTGGIIADGWRPIPRNIYIHDNAISSTGSNPRGDLITDVVAAFNAIGKGVPGILYDGIGEILANANMATAFEELPFAVGDAVCALNNTGDGNSVGYPYSPDEIPVDDGAGGILPSPFYAAPGETSYLSCATAPVRLSKAKATINGKSFGCGHDDNSSSCQL